VEGGFPENASRAKKTSHDEMKARRGSSAKSKDWLAALGLGKNERVRKGVTSVRGLKRKKEYEGGEKVGMEKKGQG